jgi:pheromone shutdown protein TraB
MSSLHWLGGHKQGFSSALEQPNLNTPFASLKEKKRGEKRKKSYKKVTYIIAMTVMMAGRTVNSK